MKAILWTAYGPPDVLRPAELEKPAPGDGEVLIRVRAATVTAGDCEARSFRFSPLFWLPLRLLFGLTRPKRVRVLGQELAGEVEAVGQGVTRFKEGDRVFAATTLRMGAYAEYVCLPETYPIAPVPAGMTCEEAATIPTGGLNGLHFVRKAGVRAGDRVLINGAGGSIGTYALQIARSLGAEVTCVDRADKLGMLRALGADRVVDYTREDFTAAGETYDVIIDVVGKSPFSRSLRALAPGGRYVLGTLTLPGMVRGLWTSATSSKRVLFEPAGYRPEDVASLVALVEAGEVKAVIDRRYPLEQVPEAHRYVDGGHKAGNVVVTV